MQVPRARVISISGMTAAAILWLGSGVLVTWALFSGLATPRAGLSVAIGLLTLFVSAIVATFSLRYMRADTRSPRFVTMLCLLVASVLCFLFTDNLIAMGAAWCASGWLLAGLIGHAKEWREATTAATSARRAFLLGDAALLAALGILGWQTGSAQATTVLAGIAQLPVMATNVAAFLLVIAAAARCALPPFSGWLLSSMTAPTPVSALMHAGLVNAGGFLLIGFAPILEAAPAARVVAVALGLCGAIYGVGIMLVRPDIKRSLAGSTVSQMGFMIMSVGQGAYAVALLHIVAHGLFKAWLFLASGSAIGMKPGTTPVALSGRASGLIAAGTFGVAVAIVAFGSDDASLVPLLLGLATASATVVASIGSRLPIRALMLLLLALVGLVAFHNGGLALARLVAERDASLIAPDWVTLMLLSVFLGAWTFQHRNAAPGRTLPLPLYVQLLNAGRLPGTIPGE